MFNNAKELKALINSIKREHDFYIMFFDDFNDHL